MFTELHRRGPRAGGSATTPVPRAGALPAAEHAVDEARSRRIETPYIQRQR